MDFERRYRDYPAEVMRVIDGDTVELRVDLGFYVDHRTTLRLARVDAAEMHEPGGPAAKEALERMLGDGRVWVRTTKDRRGNDRAGKYGRFLGEIWAPGTPDRPSININDALVANGFALVARY